MSGDRLLQTGDVALDGDQGRVVVLLAREREEIAARRGCRRRRAPSAADDCFEVLLLLAELLGALRVVPDLRVFEVAGDVR